MLIIDGHNLIGRSRDLSMDDEEHSRELLLRRIAASKGGGGQRVLVVFDGNRPERLRAKSFGGVKVAYSAGGRTADDEILRRLDASRGGLTVVTSDRELATRARARGAATLTAEEFLSRIAAAKPSEGEKEPSKPSPDPADTEHWMEIFREDGDKRR